MKIKILIGTGIVIGLLCLILQSGIIEDQEAHISSLKRSLVEHEEYVSELEKTSQKLSMELTEYESKVSDLEAELERLQEENQKLKEEKSELQSRLDSMIPLEATAYTPNCEGCSGITFTGIDVRGNSFHEGKRVVAVDPSVVPLNRTVRVHTEDGSFLATTQDIGGAIKGHRIDILFQSKSRAKEFGRQKVVLELL